MAFTVQCGIEYFRICEGEHEGPLVCYGEVATLKIGTEVYICDVPDPDVDSDQISVECVKSSEAEDTDVEYVQFDEEEDEEEADEEEVEEEEDSTSPIAS